jgi:hypothetical protein
MKQKSKNSVVQGRDEGCNFDFGVEWENFVVQMLHL